MKKWMIPMLVVLMFASHILSVDSAVEETLPLENNVSHVEQQPIEIQEDIEYFPFSEVKLGTLMPQRLILTPMESITEIGVTFTLDLEKELEIILLDMNNVIIGKYEVEAQGLLEEFGYVYKSEMKGLEGSYRYLIGDGTHYSYMYPLETLPKESFKMAFFGDTQGYKWSQYEAFSKVYELALINHTFDLAYIAGDIVDDGDAVNQWEYFDKAISKYAPSRLLVTAIGNHDVKDQRGIFENTFNYPENGVEGLSERSFYFDLPGVRFAVWDTESYKSFDEQSLWLESVMNVEGLKVVLMHRSAYPMRYNEGHIRELSSLFDDLSIDLVLSGHDHIYSRTTMKNGKNTSISDGTTYIVGGSSTGSKYYNEDVSGNRYWRQVVYDDNNPVYTILEFGEGGVNIKAYAVIDNVEVLVDEVKLEK